MTELELSPSPQRVVKKRLNKAVDPRFKPDVSDQLDPILGCPELALPESHLARVLKRQLEELSFVSVEEKYSSLGQLGYHPRHLFGALVYGSLVGIHHSTKLAHALLSDFALRYVAGGHAISEGRLRAFRRENVELFRELLQQMVKLAHEKKLIAPKQLAVDSVRLRAHASTKAARTLKRSKKRLVELAKVAVEALPAEDREEHHAKVDKHVAAVALCEKQGRSNVVLTSPSAGLMKFPSGASAPGHRATVVATGVAQRFVIDVLVDGDSNDYGKFGPAVLRARDALKKAGVPLEDGMQAAADAGYFCQEDLAFAMDNSRWVDALIAERSATRTFDDSGNARFGVEDFRREGDRIICPAQREMNGPLKDRGTQRWEGVGCEGCGLRPKCTRGKMRTLTIDPTFHRVRDAMLARMRQPDAEKRYGQRIATVEPVFSAIEENMGFRRVSSRLEASVHAEVLLKVLAYNLKRLAEAKPLRHVLMQVDTAMLPEPCDES